MTDTSQIQQVPTQQPQHSPQHQHQLQQEYVEYKLVTMPHEDPKQGYKFSVVTTPSIKFTSPQVHPQMMQSYSSLSQYSSLPHAVSCSLLIASRYTIFLKMFKTLEAWHT